MIRKFKFSLRNIVTDEERYLDAEDETDALTQALSMFSIKNIDKLSQEIKTGGGESHERLKEIIYDFGLDNWRLIKIVHYES